MSPAAHPSGQTFSTNYGALTGITTMATYADGALRSCRLNRKNRLCTPVGEIIPQYQSAVFGERQKKHRNALEFFQNGTLKSASLDQAALLNTPLGPIKAELVTFYEDGSINRIFPLNGLIDGFWSEHNERELAEVLEIDLPSGPIRNKVISLRFFPSGAVKSVTLWPGEAMTATTPIGPMTCRAGISFYETGAVHSFEPARAVDLPTPIGPIKAYDPDIIGMHADQNSVQFSPSGDLIAVSTLHSGVRATLSSGEEYRIQPFERESYIDPSQLTTVPMRITFTPEAIHLQAAKAHTFPLSGCRFSTFPCERVLQATCQDCPGDETCCKNGSSGAGEGATCCGGGHCSGQR